MPLGYGRAGPGRRGWPADADGPPPLVEQLLTLGTTAVVEAHGASDRLGSLFGDANGSEGVGDEIAKPVRRL